MNIGVIGEGMVGGAVVYGMQKLGHVVRVYDPYTRIDSSIKDVVETDIVFVCVPTPSMSDGFCDITIVVQTLLLLAEAAYSGIVVLKSTVAPGTTVMLQQRYPLMTIAFVPEFLRERMALSDFVEQHDLLVVGTDNPEAYNQIVVAHGHFPRQVTAMSPTEAEFVKYFNNCYNATLVSIANAMYEVCRAAGADYNTVKSAFVKRDHVVDRYLDVNEACRGFGGKCLPKDMRAMDALARKLNTQVEFFKMMLHENSKYPVTVFDGMRHEND